MIKTVLSKIDYGIIIVSILLIAIGLTALNSASHGAFSNAEEYSKQIIWDSVGGLAFLIFMLIDYKHIKKLVIPIYIFTIVLLILVLFSPANNGATSWFKVGQLSFQPAEFAKITLIITIAKLVDAFENEETLNQPISIMAIALAAIIPSILIILQPDYGTALSILFFISVMVFVGRIKIRYIVIALLWLAIAVPVAYQTILPEHAKRRIEVFLDPSKDPSGAGYNVIQSELAVGAGELTGMGLYNGNQTQLGTLPMKTTDFIFSVIGEEMGFIVSSLVVVLYGILLIRILHIAKKSKDKYGEMVCIGVFAMILFHVVENIGMCMGLLPVTGVPLPLISYGGSFTLTTMILLGMCESVSVHRKKHLF